MIEGLFFILIVILVIVKLIIRNDIKKRQKTQSYLLDLREQKEYRKEKTEFQNNLHNYKYEYWNEIIDGTETFEIDKSEVSSQILLDNWEYISKYYYVIKEEVSAMRNDTDFKEEQIIYDLSSNHYLTKGLYRINLDLIKHKIIGFLTNILENSQKLREPEANIPLKAISIIYSLQGNYNFYLCAEPSRLFHNDKYSKYIPEFELRHEFDIDIDRIETEILKELNVLSGDYYDEYSDYTYDLFSEFMFECWKIAKQKTSSKLLGSLDYGSGGIDYDLDTKEGIDDSKIKEHYKNRGITIEKDLES
ncbi:hypothetical protein CXF68_09715 [Tenacibaculum sp. Bg11-29]|uniref:hypothetical protein n=1 Tax=Tenacibaculum sp. Bg11-29 TaxID=2058306 RepID=UPI000C31DCC6|nr:hypothetical protein [Tenacibaculum sp. Bg11-29]PKH50943.1 hypothetical protein CXF68_09715 [Tenacibaculum sp. Bg11-29]